MSGDNFNCIVIEGNLSKDAEIKDIKGSKLAKFRICSSSRNEKTIYIDCEWWDPTRAVDYLTKGKKVIARGSLVVDEWEDKNTREKNSRLFVRVDHLELRSNGTKVDIEEKAPDLVEELSASKSDLPF